MIASDGETVVFVRVVYELMMSPGRDECLLGDCGVMGMTMIILVRL